MRLRLVSLLLLASAYLLPAADLRLGIIGTDTSHATAFTQLLNNPNDPNHRAGARVVAAWKGGSLDVEESARRVNQYATELKDKWGVKLVDSIAQLCPDVDGLLLESVDGRPHLEQFQQALACGKPVFIDKPLASTVADAREIARLAREKSIPWFSASSLRYSPIAELRRPDVRSAIMWAPGPFEKHQQLDLSWYGIHGIEMLYTVLGMGCVEVSRVSAPDFDVITGKWSDGRLGTVHLQRPYGRYGGIVYLENQKLIAMPDISFNYASLVDQILKFMQTGTPPVSNEETLEIFAFMDAARKSVAQGGTLVKLERQ